MFPILLWEMSVLPILLREKIGVPNPAMGKYRCSLDQLWKNISAPNPAIGQSQYSLSGYMGKYECIPILPKGKYHCF
jgi:hypothetical protein